MHASDIKRPSRLRHITILLLCFLTISLFCGYAPNNATPAFAETQTPSQASAAPQRIVVFPLFAEEMLLEMIGPERIVYVGHPYFENAEAYSPTIELTKNIPGSEWQNTDFQEVLDLKPDLIILNKGDPEPENSNVPSWYWTFQYLWKISRLYWLV